MNGPNHRTQDSNRRSRLRGHIAMLVYAVLIAGSFSLGALAVPHLAPAALNAVRFVIATLIMGVLLARSLGGLPRVPNAPWRFAVVGALMAAYFVLMFIALTLTGPISTGAVYTLTPLMAAVFGFFILRQSASAIVITSLLVSATGAIIVIFRGDVHAILAFDVGKGELVYLVGCACLAAYAPLARRLNQGESVLEFTFWTFLACTSWIALVSIPDAVSTDWLSLPLIVWFCIAYVSIFATAISLFLLLYASQSLPASKVFAYGYLTPSFVIIIEGLIGHGWPSLSIAIGAIVTVMGLVLLALSPDR